MSGETLFACLPCLLFWKPACLGRQLASCFRQRALSIYCKVSGHCCAPLLPGCTELQGRLHLLCLSLQGRSRARVPPACQTSTAKLSGRLLLQAWRPAAPPGLHRPQRRRGDPAGPAGSGRLPVLPGAHAAPASRGSRGSPVGEGEPDVLFWRHRGLPGTAVYDSAVLTQQDSVQSVSLQQRQLLLSVQGCSTPTAKPSCATVCRRSRSCAMSGSQSSSGGLRSCP